MRNSALFCLFFVLLSSPDVLCQQLSIVIVQPSDGALVHPGDTVPIRLVLNHTPPNPTMFLVVPQQPLGWSDLVSSPDYLFVNIPIDVNPGYYSLTALASSPTSIGDQGFQIASDPIAVDVERSDNALNVSIEPSGIDFQAVGDTLPLIVDADFEAAQAIDVTRSPAC